MGFLERLFGADDADGASGATGSDRGTPPARRRRTRTADERAIERYRYLLRTAPPETIEQVHAEAFAKLTDEQRAVIYEELSRGAGTGERPLSSEPTTLARVATRAEMREPGRLEHTLRAPNAAPGFGSIVVGSLLGTVAGYVIGSALVSAFLPWDAAYDRPADAAGDDASAAEGAEGDVVADAGFGDIDFGF